MHFAGQVAQANFEVPKVTRWIQQRVASPEVAQDPRMIERLLAGSSDAPRRSCTVCRTPLRLRAWVIVCPKCKTAFEVRLNAGLISPGAAGTRTPRIQVLAGLRILPSLPPGP